MQRDGSLTGGFTANVYSLVDFNDIGGTANSSYNQGDTFVISGGADIITDWNAGAINALDTGTVASLAFAAASPGAMSFGLSITVASQANLAFRGDYNQATQTFILSSTGQDVGVVTTNGAITPATANYLNNFTVLTGAGGTALDNSSFILVNPLPA